MELDVGRDEKVNKQIASRVVAVDVFGSKATAVLLVF